MRTMIDTSVDKFVTYAKWAASQAFVPTSQAPQKPWISQTSWTLIRAGSVCKKSLRNAARNAKCVFMAAVLRLWAIAAAVCRQASGAEETAPIAVAMVSSWCHPWQRSLDILIALARRTMTELLRIKRPSLRWDHQVALSETAAAAQRAADRNDSTWLAGLRLH